jgi:hypothetical protein
MRLIDLEGIKSLDNLFLKIIKSDLTADAWSWLEAKTTLIKAEDKPTQLNLSFSHLPRITGKENINVQAEDTATVEKLLPGFSLDTWTIDRLCRVWLLMQVPANDQKSYIGKISGLFTAAEMNEQVALYTALPLLFYPQTWIARCEEGIRSNIGTVLEAIMYHNPYPAMFLPQPSWNQLVLKAFFTEKDVCQIVGLQDRLNPQLAATLQDYTQERLAAHRTVAPEIYQLIEQTNQKK